MNLCVYSQKNSAVNHFLFCWTVDEDEEEEEESLSASRLLTQFRGAGDEDNDYDEYYD